MKTLHTIYSTFAKHNMAKFLTVLTMLLIVGIGQMWGAENYSWTCSGSTTFSTSGSSLNGVTWKASTSGTSQGTGVSGEKCVQIAKNTGLTLETTFFKDKNITSISIQTWGSQGNTFNLKDDNTQLASTTIPTSYTSNGAKITFSNVGTIKTKLVFNWASASKAFNVRSINITYEDATSSCSVKPTVGTSLQSVTATENSIKATIPITAVGGCNITENGLVYSTTNSTPTVDGSGCTTVTTTACGSTAANKTVTITGLTCGQSYYIRGYATNEAGTSYTDVTTQSTSDCPKYTVTLKDDDSTLTQSSAGESVTLPPRNGCVGYTFVGWTNSWSVAQTTWTTTAPTIIPAGSYTPTADESLYPVYTKSVEDDVESTLEDINISPSSFNADPLGSGNYASGKEYTATINGITLGGHYIAYNNANTPSSGTSAKAYIQMQKNNGNLYNITAFPGPITKISISQNSATADLDLYVGTEQLFASDNTQTAQTPSGDFVETKTGTSIIWEITKQEYTHFCLKKGNTGTGYISSISITYLSGGGTTTTTSYISVPDCCTQLAEVTNLKFSSITSNSITVAVPDDYSDEANASGYTFNCYSALTGGTLIATADESGTSHTFTGLTQNTTYYFTVIAKGEGKYCNSIETSARESSKTLTQYTITLNPNGGTGDFSGWSNYAMTVDAGTEITLPELSKTGYDFEGWHDGTKTVTSPYIPTTDITLTAQWTPQIYTIIYKDHGDVAFSGTHESGYPPQHTYGKATTLKGATKIGYTFNGWYTNSACIGNPITQLGATDYTGDITLYAQWTEKALTNYRTDCDACIPFDGYAEINGTYHFFPGETITLTVTPPADADPADCTYQWQKKVNSDYENIDGEIGITYTKEKATTSDVGHYRCVVSSEGYCDTIAEYNVKCLQLYVYWDDKSDKSNQAFTKVDGTTATTSIKLEHGLYTYYFKITDGCENWYGNTGTMESNNCTNWSMNANAHCGLTTTKLGTYVFTVDYSELTQLEVSVTYPSGNQEAGKVIYWDNNVLNWNYSNNTDGTNKIYYRIGHNDHNNKIAMDLVPGTANFYKVTTSKYDNFDAWHIANNGCHSEYNSIYKTNTGDDWAATQATAFEPNPVTASAITVTPTTEHSTGNRDINNNCEFYNYNITEGMKTWNAKIVEPTNGTITVSYTHHDGTAVNDFTSDDKYLAHTCLLTITATADEGYSLTSLTVNDVPFTSGNTHILTDNAVIKAEFTINTHVLTWNVNGGNSLTGEYTQGSVDYGTPITPPADPTRAGHTFKGWIDQNGQTTVQTTMPDYDLTYTAQWQINQYTVTLHPNYPDGKTGTFKDKDGNTISGDLVLTYDYGTASQTITELYQTIKLDGYRFDGWYNAKGASEGTVSGSKWSETKIITEDLNFYAKWTEVDCRWIETDIANINSDDEVIVAMVTPLGVYALDYSKGSSAYPPAELIEIVGNEAKFLVTSHSNSIWNISGNAIDGYILRPNGDSRNALYCTATNYNVKVGTGTDNLFTIDGGYLKNKTHNVYVGVYNSSDWRHYPANTGNAIAGQTLKFYKRVCVDALNPWYTVTFNAGSGSCDTESLTGTEDEGITLPTATPSEECQDEWTFVGWATTSVTETNTAPTLFSSGDKYYPANNCTLYAVYSKEDTNEGGDTTSKEASLSFASTDQRTSFSSTQQVWEQNGITLTNDQAASTSPVADYANPARFYANSEIIIEAPGYITQIVFDCNSESYATAMKNSIDAEASVSGDKVTLELDGTSNTYTSSISAQVRIDALTVTYLAESGPTTTYNSNPDCATYTLIFNDRGVETSDEYSAGYQVPQPADPTDVCTEPIEYVFDGWATAEITAENVTSYEKVTFPFTMPAGSTTLYAVYRYVEEGSGNSGDYVKVTDNLDDYSGDYLIVYEEGGLALNGALEGDNLDASGNSISVTITNNTIVATDEINASNFTIAKENDKYSIRSASGYYIGQSTNANDLKTNSTEYYANTITLGDDDKVDIVSSGAYLRYNANSGSTNLRFRYYKSDSYTSQKAIALYRKAASYLYTTSPVCGPHLVITEGKEIYVTGGNAGGTRDLVIAQQKVSYKATRLQTSNGLVDGTAPDVKVATNGITVGGVVTSDVKVTIDQTKEQQTDGTYTITGTITVQYQPSANNKQEDIQVQLAVDYNTDAKDNFTVHARSLPAEFVIVAKSGDKWYALNGDMNTNAANPANGQVTLDNDDNPTKATYAPCNTIYTFDGLPNTGDRTYVRFQGTDGAWLWASSGTNTGIQNNVLKTTPEGNNNAYNWKLYTQDNITYQFGNANSNRQLTLNGEKFGMYTSGVQDIRILPYEAKCLYNYAPSNLKVSVLKGTYVTLTWDAVAGATKYQYSTDATNWTDAGTDPTVTINGLTSASEYTYYIRAYHEDAGVSQECIDYAEITFTTADCDDVPTNITYTADLNSITVSWTAAAPTATIKLFMDAEGTQMAGSYPSAKSPYIISGGLDKNTTYYIQILSDGTCASPIIPVKTEDVELDIVEWKTDSIVVDINTNETVGVTLENEVSYGTGLGTEATELFFSKYYEATGNVKLVAVYNGTKNIIDLTNYTIQYGKTSWESNYITLKDFGTIKGQIQPGEEIILYSMQEKNAEDDKEIMDCVHEQYPDGAWVKVTASNNEGGGNLQFGGDKTIILCETRYDETDGEYYDYILDVIGALTDDFLPDPSATKKPSWGDKEGWVCETGLSIADDSQIGISTNRCLLIRNNTVTSGENAVASNINDFVTLCTEWKGAQVPDNDIDNGVAASCENFAYVGTFDYSDYYTKYEEMPGGTSEFDENDRNPDGTVSIYIPDLYKRACSNIRVKLTNSDGEVLTDREYKVPIMITTDQATAYTDANKDDNAFYALQENLATVEVDGDGNIIATHPLSLDEVREICKTCDVVIRDNATLTKALDDDTNDHPQVNNVMIYEGASLEIPSGADYNYTINSLSLRRKGDIVASAKVEKGGKLHLPASATAPIYLDMRIDANNWHWFTLPYDCNIADVTWVDGTPAQYNKDWFIMYYDGNSRANEQSIYENHWKVYNGTTIEAGKGYIVGIQGDITHPDYTFELRFPMTTDVLTNEHIDKTVAVNAWGVDMDITPNKKGWNLVGNPYMDYYKTSENISFNGLSLIKYEGIDPVTGERLYQEGGNVPFLVTPVDGGWYEYQQELASDIEMMPFTAYFVQVGDPANASHTDGMELHAQFESDHRGRMSLIRRAPQEVDGEQEPVIVRVEVANTKGESDKTTLIIDDRFTNEYEMNGDFFKWFGDYYKYYTKPVLYTIGADQGKRAFNALNEELAAQPVALGMFAAQAGDYTFTLTRKRCDLSRVEEVWLYDATTATYTNLMQQDYTFTTAKTEGEGRFYLSVKMKQKTPTAVENVNGNLSLVAHQQTLVLSGLPAEAQVWVYDATGKLLHSEHTTAYQRIYPVQQAGVYFVSVKGQGDAQTLSTIVK